MKKPQKLALPIPWFSLDELARDWECTVDNLQALIGIGAVMPMASPIPGDTRIGIGAEERRRIERENRPEPEASPQKLRSALFLIGSMAVAWVGEDARLLSKPYELRDDVARGFAAKGISPLRSRETDAELLAEALAFLVETGNYSPPNHPHRERAVTEAMELVEAQRHSKYAPKNDDERKAA